MYSKTYKRYVISVLLLVYIFNFMDRQILAILMEPIKEDLGLSDTQLGLLSGIAFAAFYTTLGIPIAWWADRANRVNIISMALVIWSGLTAMCGLVANFMQLFLVRLGVGVGEAGCTPPAHSIISDYFDRKERPKAVSIYMQGIPIGVMLGLLIGGYVNEYFGWRATFMLVGLPGLLVALLLKLTVKEPKRTTPMVSTHEHPRIPQVMLSLWRNVTFRHVVIAHSLFAWVGYGVGQWFVPYIIRRFNMETGELGLYSAFVYGGGVMIGTWLGGYLASKYSERNPAFPARLCAIGVMLGLPMYMAALFIPSPIPVMFAMVPTYICLYLCLSPTFALFQNLADARMRAMATAVAMLVINLIGMGLGPLAVGFLSDVLATFLGPVEGLRVSMLCCLSVLAWCAFHYWWAGRTMAADLHVATISEDQSRGNTDNDTSASAVAIPEGAKT